VENRDAVFKALEEGKTLTNTVTGLQYRLIDGKLHLKSSERIAWEPSELSFFNPQSWLNIRE